MAKLELFQRDHLLRQIKANPRLQLGLGLILVIILVNGALLWSDRIADQNGRLAKLNGEIANLKRQSLSEAVLQKDLAELDHIETVVRERLWSVSSEAVGQARLRDWLDEVVASTKLPKAVISLASPPNSQSNAAAKSSSGGGLREFRGNVSFVFSPEAVEQFLYVIEGAQPFVMVESLTLNRRDRRAEVGLRCLMWLEAGGKADSREGARP